MITRPKIEACTGSDVQRSYMQQFSDLHYDCCADLYDNANFIAALRKMAILVIKETIEFGEDSCRTPEQIQEMVTAAMKDWAGWKDEVITENNPEKGMFDQG